MPTSRAVREVLSRPVSIAAPYVGGVHAIQWHVMRVERYKGLYKGES